jgi:hypothetical protein|tara:strand:- start:1040 stop:1396 length:357 start_codon:yes stop_codon:yes gene_type:complete
MMENENDKGIIDDEVVESSSEDTPSSPNDSSDDKLAVNILNYVIDIIYSIGFLVLAYMAFWVLVVLSILSFVVRLVGSEQLKEMKDFSRRLSIFTRDCLLFSTGNEDKKPFPFNKFPE